MKKLLFAGMIAGAISLVACNEQKESSTEVAKEQNENMMDSTNTTKMDDDATFAVEAANGGMMEVKASELAKTNATSPALKDFAAMMVNDHTAANNQLKSLAAAQNITLPASLGTDMQKNYDDLAAKKGADFDKAYADMMQSDHNKTIDKFQDEANNGKNMAIKDFATKTIPTLKMHKAKIDALVNGMKK